MKIYNSEKILNSEDLYELQDSFSSSGTPFKYQLTDGEIEWAKFNKGKYCINDFVLSNTDENNILSFDCPFEMSEAIYSDGCEPKAVMLSDDTALQKLFFWLYNEPEQEDTCRNGKEWSKCECC